MQVSSSLLVLAVLFLLVGCQTPPPTKVFEKHEKNIRVLVEGARKPLVLGKDVVVIDARSAFNYATAHLPGSINLSWTDFTKPEQEYRGVLNEDKFAMTRRLARLGVSPKSRVIVIGHGQDGRGQEGRLAWTLFYLGLTDIQVTAEHYFKAKRTTLQEKPRKNAPMWKPRLRHTVSVGREELLRVIGKSNQMYKSVGKATRLPANYVVLDVRSEEEVKGEKGLSFRLKMPDLGATRMEWKQFFDSDGRPNLDVKKQLIAMGVTPDKRIIVISSHGLRSGAVTMALLSLGYAGAGNYEGGINELVARGGL